ncbi:hypothetical protein [Spirochaeta cellobiosiphila]|uniref:hypothetical protein n=1 Tax=Spirochaeta cellobiosiphila TaxID=504483 RepID=UPI00041D373C|nr:hypothetical protein [Spirochaeta cellobiosiphila]
MKRKKWTHDDSVEWLDKIRSEYNHLVVRYGKSPRLKSAFEDRYYEALRKRLDLPTFFKAEWEVAHAYNEVEEFKKTVKVKQKEKEPPKKKKPTKPFVERVLDELRSRIVKYPRIHIHEESSEDMERLYGAITQFDKEYWSELDNVFRDYYPIRQFRPTSKVETMLVNLSSPSDGSLPRNLDKYVNMLNNDNISLSIITKEHKRCILEASFFFHEVRNFIYEFQNDQNLEETDSLKVKKVLTFVEQVLDDFRLKDLKPV